MAAGATLRSLLDKAPEGTALCLRPGVYLGPFTIGAGVTVWGPREAVVRSVGAGSTLTIAGRGGRLLGVTVDGSGGRFDLLDAAVRVEADDAVVAGVRIERALFGVLVERARRITVRSNEVIGTDEAALGLRGDGIRLWETYDSVVEGNFVDRCRDLVVWYSSGNHVVGNTVRGGRYGTHLMYSHHNQVERNRYLGDVVGLFVMYSSDVAIRDNLMADSSGAAGIGLGLKESGDLVVTGNQMIRNTVAIYVDTSPLGEKEWNRFEGNAFRLGDTGVVFHGPPARAAFLGNCFCDNRIAVEVDGGSDALGIEWRGNHFDDYRGYDLDGDGVGDVPYELRSLSGELASRYPDLAFFRGTPSLALVEVAGEALPLLQPRAVLRDGSPRVGPEACASHAG